MGDLFRSTEMQRVQLFVQIEAAHDTVDELGQLGCLQFVDLNQDVSTFQRNFVNEVKRIDEMERKVRFFDEQVMKEKRELFTESKSDKSVLTLLKTLDEKSNKKIGTVDELEQQFEELEKELLQMNSNQEVLNRNYNELIEMKYVLTKDAAFFSEAAAEFGESPQPVVPLEAPSKTVKLGFVTGVIRRDKFSSFERVLWRSTRGNLFMKHADIEEKLKDPHLGEYFDKNVFIIFFQGERASVKIKKICESFGANTYQIPDTPAERKNFLTQVNSRLEDLNNVIARTKKHRRQVLMEVGQSIGIWKEKVIKEKAIYTTMNLFNYDIGRKCLIAEGWCPKTATEKIVTAMRKATESSGALVPSILSVVKTHEEPPTYFQTNKFTASFQALIDSYGIAHYREVNPGVFAIITFPFLFAVMFGDFGHGIIMTLVAAALIANEKKLAGKPLNEMVKTLYDGRYLILLMGIFSMYTGLLYNETFAVAMNIFGSSYKFIGNDTVATWDNTTYPFGVDPAWNGAPNMLNYYNSLKMKMSVILGVAQMMAGIFLSLVNALHFNHGIDIIGEFIPQVIFMMALFGYMCFLIIYKWVRPWNDRQPPFILTVMISMFLSPTTINDDNYMFDGQKPVQLILIFLALISVPWMLLTKPLYLRRQHKMRLLKKELHSEDESEHDEHGEEFDFGEIFVKQIIHTIEYVLGAISNTASYLRLWALSLAHSELSAVFWERVFVLTLEIGAENVGQGIFAVFIGFAIWAGLTTGVLMVMESLSAFLHALRLHWVEFQNKFYHGDGYKFVPFSYDLIFNADEE